MKPKVSKAYEQMIDRDIVLPWEVGRIINSKKIYFASDQASLTPEGDYANLEELRTVVDYLADQFGGEVKWKRIP